MAEPIQISTSKYNQQGKVSIDGHIWTVKMPGAATELRLSQALRAGKAHAARIELIDKKIDAGTASIEDLDMYEEYEQKYQENERYIFEFFTGVFHDGTPDNSEVAEWVKVTPMYAIEMAFEDIKKAAKTQPEKVENPSKEEATDGQKEPSASTN